jgi:hypothetical protein
MRKTWSENYSFGSSGEFKDIWTESSRFEDLSSNGDLFSSAFRLLQSQKRAAPMMNIRTQIRTIQTKKFQADEVLCPLPSSSLCSARINMKLIWSSKISYFGIRHPRTDWVLPKILISSKLSWFTYLESIFIHRSLAGFEANHEYGSIWDELAVFDSSCATAKLAWEIHYVNKSL